MNVYVYYKVAPNDGAALATRVRAMQATLSGEARRIRLMRRPEDDAASQTWMEIYEDVAATFDERLRAAVVAHGLDHLSRHAERFVELP